MSEHAFLTSGLSPAFLLELQLLIAHQWPADMLTVDILWQVFISLLCISD